MADPREKWLHWDNGKLLSLQELHELTGLEIKRPSMIKRLKQARENGYAVETLSDQISALKTNRTAIAEGSTDESEIPLSASLEEAQRIKVIRDAQLTEEKRKREEIKAQLERKEVFLLDAIQGPWASMVVGVREALMNCIPNLVDSILASDDRDDAVDRAEAEFIRHLKRVSDFDLERTLNDQTGDETWEFKESD